MSEGQNLISIGPKSFLDDGAVGYKHGAVTILYDSELDSVKVKIEHRNFTKMIPTKGGVSPDQLVIITDSLAAILEEFGHKELAKNILAAFSRFMISKPRVERKVIFR